jgi:hypothetical protein
LPQRAITLFVIVGGALIQRKLSRKEVNKWQKKAEITKNDNLKKSNTEKFNIEKCSINVVLKHSTYN